MHNRPQVQPEDFFTLKGTTEELAFLLQYAILAPSSHNTQPWKFYIRGVTLEVWADASRRLPASDVNGRQMFISVGCALENLLLAADYYGWPVTTDLFPDPSETHLVARLVFKESPYLTKDIDHFPHLFYAIPERHNNRNPYEVTPVPEEFLDACKKLEAEDLRLFFITDETQKEKSTDIVGKATHAAFSDRGFRQELSSWMRPSLRKYKDGIPGYNIGVPWLLSFLMPFMIRFFPIRRAQRKMVEAWCRATPVFGVIATATDEPADWTRAGQVYERIALMATARRLKTAVLAAPIQIGNYFKELMQLLGTHMRPQVFFRLGYTSKVPKSSPRRSVAETFIKT
jgi:hypothetical protein